MSLTVIEAQVQAAGLTFPVLRAGATGPLVVCLHGFPDNPEGYRGIAATLAAQGYQVVCPYLPGYSPLNQRRDGAHDPVFVRDALNTLVEVLLKETGQQQCHLVGHDWGSVIACLMAQHRPDLFKTLCAMSVPYGMSWLKIATRCPVYIVHAWYILFFQLRSFADWLISRKGFALLAWLLKFWSPGYAGMPSMQKSVIKTFQQPGVLKAALEYYRTSMFSFMPLGFHIRSLFNKTIPVRTLALRGQFDVTMPEAVWEVVSPKAFPKGITLEVYAGAGHFTQYERADAIAQRLLAWFKQGETAA
ncbi:MAG TPA: alpha/beta hydrolase [Limnobacter sp.]|uniref:alpha/beta fold hydrolase n=1 Tax=Limnobacter sp. TaxID=2003368 RepID=UPI002EDA5C65